MSQSELLSVDNAGVAIPLPSHLDPRREHNERINLQSPHRPVTSHHRNFASCDESQSGLVYVIKIKMASDTKIPTLTRGTETYVQTLVSKAGSGGVSQRSRAIFSSCNGGPRTFDKLISAILG